MKMRLRNYETEKDVETKHMNHSTVSNTKKGFTVQYKKN